MNNKSFKVIDFSGYSFSGKSAYYDLVREFDTTKSYLREFEFELLRVPGGILELYSNLTYNWSPIRSSESIREYIKLIKKLGGNSNLLSRLSNNGNRYDEFFPEFTKLSRIY